LQAPARRIVPFPGFFFFTQTVTVRAAASAAPGWRQVSARQTIDVATAVRRSQAALGVR
jgi:hypothetical protein